MKLLKIILVILVSITLMGCQKVTKSDNLTVTNIHDKVIKDKTTSKDLKELFGEPLRYIHDSEKTKELYAYWSNYEGGVNYSLENNTDYWETIQDTIKGNKYSYSDFDGYYEYSGKNLGIKSVYFIMINDKVFSFKFNGDIVDESVAQKDKYLRQILF